MITFRTCRPMYPSSPRSPAYHNIWENINWTCKKPHRFAHCNQKMARIFFILANRVQPSMAWWKIKIELPQAMYYCWSDENMLKVEEDENCGCRCYLSVQVFRVLIFRAVLLFTCNDKCNMFNSTSEFILLYSIITKEYFSCHSEMYYKVNLKWKYSEISISSIIFTSTSVTCELWTLLNYYACMLPGGPIGPINDGFSSASCSASMIWIKMFVSDKNSVMDKAKTKKISTSSNFTRTS